MDNPILYRKRIIPEECIHLKDDQILECNEQYILTSWNALKPKKNLHHGYSCYFLKEGFKVSKFYREDHSLLYWYCDIVHYDYNPLNRHMVVTDLLADVIVYPDGFVKVVDMEEIADALDAGMIPLETVKQGLRNLAKLLNIIYGGEFDRLTGYIEKTEAYPQG